MADHQCGPAYAKEFFDGVRDAVTASRATGKYFVSCIDHETDLIGVDFEESVGVTSVRGDHLITEFVDRRSLSARSGLRAFKWLGSMPIGYVEDRELPEAQFGGPATDASLFQSLDRLCETFPAEGKKYAVVSRSIFIAGLHLSGDTDVVEGTIKDGKVYHKVKAGDAVPASCECCTWDDETGNCSGTWCDQ